MINITQNPFNNSAFQGAPGYQSESDPPPAKLNTEHDDGYYGRFALEPLANGWGTTVGNALRRSLLSSLTGAAITWIKIEGVQHETTSIPHVFEEVNDLIDNIKGIQLRPEVNRPGRLRLEVHGKSEVKAGDLMASSDFEIMNPDHHLAYLEHADARLSLELNVETGKGFREAVHSKDYTIGTISIDAIFSPVFKAAFNVEPRRYQNFIDLECLIFEVWTNSTVTPSEAIRLATGNIIEQFNLLFDSGQSDSTTISRSKISPEIYSKSLDSLDMSARTCNALGRAGFERVGEVIERPRKELLAIRNFGLKSFNELVAKLDELNIEHPWAQNSDDDDEEV